MAVIVGCLLEKSAIFERQELQTINRRFEARQWLVWSPESIKRLNPHLLWDYHQKHDIPRQWWFWDYTLSWLLENNHPKVLNKIVIFNRSYEDEPPTEAVAQFPWMKPLLDYPLSRKTMAEMVQFLASAGAKIIILDNDFPQYNKNDKDLAEAIHQCSVGKFGRIVPVFFVRTVNRGSSSGFTSLLVPSSPSGVLFELSKLEPGIDVVNKYTGMTSLQMDPDQVVRSIWTRIKGAAAEPGSGPEIHKTIVVKVLASINRPPANDLPEIMEIDFSSPPKSELYPVRPLNYLLDPEQRAAMIAGNSSRQDVNVKNAIVFIGDGISDVYNTPFTNEGLETRSGTDILAQALETIARGSWPQRLIPPASYLYILATAAMDALLWSLWKFHQHAARKNMHPQKYNRLTRSIIDVSFSCLLLAGTYAVACLIFAGTGVLVPVFVPAVSIGVATLAVIILEREQEKEKIFRLELNAAEEKLRLEQGKFTAELAQKEAEAQAREMKQDRQRRHEFVRRINHDLNAPVTVLNWTLSELHAMKLESSEARDKVSRLVKSSDKLCELIDQLIQSYNYESPNGSTNSQSSLCDLVTIIDDCIDGQKPLAEKYNDSINWVKPQGQILIKANSTELSRSIDNLIRNAIKHNPNNTKVFISLESNSTFHKITVVDTGKGIGPEYLERIFLPGYRIHHNNEPGHGLGLDIAKTLIESMGGTITVSSLIGKGTSFQVKLPVYIAGSADQEEPLTAQTFDNKEQEEEETEPKRETVIQGASD